MGKQIVQRNQTATSNGKPWIDRTLAATLVLALAGLAWTASLLLYRESHAWVIVAAVLAGLIMTLAERIESRFAGAMASSWSTPPGILAPIAIIAIATSVVCVPTLHSYFSGDEFAYIPLFQDLSLRQFLHLFHSDLSQGVLGWSPHELRPLYGLSFNLSYRLWGLHPLGYHLTSILLHTLNAALVFLIVRKIAPESGWRAAFAGLLFAMQPIHSWTISWANGSLTEAVPSLFYILAFYCFVSYRASGQTRFFVFSVAAFAACLFSKETSVTLVVMLVSYDAFLVVRGTMESTDTGRCKGRRWFRLIAEYLPYVVLLVFYLELRRVAFSNYLLEDKWGTHLGDAAVTPAGFWLHFRHLIRDIFDIQLFNVWHLLLWLPTREIAITLGVYLSWMIALLRHRSEFRPSIVVILYFGIVWYGITNLPLLASYNDAHHLYLPSIGPCIAAAFLAVPARNDDGTRPKYVRLIGAALLVIFCAIQLHTEDVAWARKAEVTEKGTTQLAAALAKMPKPALVVVWFPEESSPTESWDEDLPYSLQRPFQSSDLYSRAYIIEHPDIYCCPLNHWWPKIRSSLEAALSGDSERDIDLERFSWDPSTSSFQVLKRDITHGELRRRLEQVLGKPIEEVESVESFQADHVVEDLAKLAGRGTNPSVSVIDSTR